MNQTAAIVKNQRPLLIPGSNGGGEAAGEGRSKPGPSGALDPATSAGMKAGLGAPSPVERFPPHGPALGTMGRGSSRPHPRADPRSPRERGGLPALGWQCKKIRHQQQVPVSWQRPGQWVAQSPCPRAERGMCIPGRNASVLRTRERGWRVRAKGPV